MGWVTGEMESTGDAERARYIASMCEELAKLAEPSGFDTGAYLLRMACLEFAEIKTKSELTLQGNTPAG
jgi:hypothetical protein